MTTPDIRDRIGREPDWTGEVLASVYELDVEIAIFNVVGRETFDDMRENDLIEPLVGAVKKRLIDNLVTDARLDEYIMDIVAGDDPDDTEDDSHEN